MNMFAKFISIFFFSVCFTTPSIATNVCTVWLLGKSDSFAETSLFRKLKKMSDPRNAFIAQTMNDARNCLESSAYDEIVIIAHSIKLRMGNARLLFRTDQNENKIILPRLFESIKLNEHIKQITWVICFPELVFESYPSLEKWPVRHRFAPKTLTNEIFGGDRRSPDLSLIKEIFQPESSKILCYINGSSDQSCSHGKYLISGLDSLSLGSNRGLFELERSAVTDLEIGQSVQIRLATTAYLGFFHGIQITPGNVIEMRFPIRIQANLGIGIRAGDRVTITRMY